MTPRRGLLAVAVASCALVFFYVLARRSPSEGPRAEPVASSASSAERARADTPAPVASAASVASSPAYAIPAPKATAGGGAIDTTPTAARRAPPRPSSPRENLAIAMRLLEAGDDDAFRATFLPSVRSQLTTSAIESCRRRLVGKTLKPDWEVAESSVEPNEAGAAERIVRVSIFGKSMTGFHEVAPDEWLTDAAWCVPIF